MKKINCLLKLTSILLIGLFVINIEATPIEDSANPKFINAWIDTSDLEPTNIGEQILIPIQIDRSPKWESVTFGWKVSEPTEAGVNKSALQIENTFVFDNTKQAPCTIYIPATITEEGFFEVIGKLYVKLPDGRELVYPERPTRFPPLKVSFFAFNKKYVLHEIAYAAIGKIARYNLTQINDEISKLIVKDNYALKELLRNNLEKFAEIKKQNHLSREEKKIIDLSINKERIKIEEEYFTKYPPLESRVTDRPY